MISVVIPSRKEPKILALMQEIETSLNVDQIVVFNDRDSRGKGYAVRKALSQAEGEYIIIIDGDFDIEPRMIERLVPFLKDYDIVVSTKPIRGLFSRKILTFLSRLYIRFLFGINVDTQTGLKIFKRHALSGFKTDGYAYDIEILYRAKLRNLPMIEVPIEANIRKKMPLKNIIKTFLDSLRIYHEIRTQEANRKM